MAKEPKTIAGLPEPPEWWKKYRPLRWLLAAVVLFWGYTLLPEGEKSASPPTTPAPVAQKTNQAPVPQSEAKPANVTPPVETVTDQHQSQQAPAATPNAALPAAAALAPAATKPAAQTAVAQTPQAVAKAPAIAAPPAQTLAKTAPTAATMAPVVAPAVTPAAPPARKPATPANTQAVKPVVAPAPVAQAAAKPPVVVTRPVAPAMPVNQKPAAVAVTPVPAPQKLIAAMPAPAPPVAQKKATPPPVATTAAPLKPAAKAAMVDEQVPPSGAKSSIQPRSGTGEPASPYTAVAADPVLLMDQIHSYQNVEAVTAFLQKSGYTWSASQIVKPKLRSYPPYRTDTLTVSGYRHMGQEGQLTLEFFNDRLYETDYLPANPAEYLNQLRKHGVPLKRSGSSHSELMLGNLHIETNIDFVSSDVGKEMHINPYIFWRDERLMQQMKNWGPS